MVYRWTDKQSVFLEKVNFSTLSEKSRGSELLDSDIWRLFGPFRNQFTAHRQKYLLAAGWQCLPQPHWAQQVSRSGLLLLKNRGFSHPQCPGWWPPAGVPGFHPKHYTGKRCERAGNVSHIASVAGAEWAIWRSRFHWKHYWREAKIKDGRLNLSKHTGCDDLRTCWFM